MKNIKLTRLLLRLIFVYSCLKVNLSKGQINGDDVKEAEYPNAGFRSQVLVEVKYHWRPLDLPEDATTRVVNHLQSRHNWIYTFAEDTGSGTIIGAGWILTAAHIFKKKYENFPFPNGDPIFTMMPVNAVRDGRQYVELEGTVYYVKVMAGQHNKREWTNRYSASHVIIHHGYQGDRNVNDIALIRLKSPLDLNRNPDIETLPLAPFQPKNYPFNPMDCAIAGWGTTNEGYKSDVLLWAPIRIVDITPSRDGWIESFFDDAQWTAQERSRLIAAGQRRESFSFKVGSKTVTRLKKVYPRAAVGPGDSGGGLVCKYRGNRYLFGVSSFGSNDFEFEQWGTPGVPALFTNVFQYRAWIEREMGRHFPRSENTMFM